MANGLAEKEYFWTPLETFPFYRTNVYRTNYIDQTSVCIIRFIYEETQRRKKTEKPPAKHASMIQRHSEGRPRSKFIWKNSKASLKSQKPCQSMSIPYQNHPSIRPKASRSSLQVVWLVLKPAEDGSAGLESHSSEVETKTQRCLWGGGKDRDDDPQEKRSLLGYGFRKNLMMMLLLKPKRKSML